MKKKKKHTTELGRQRPPSPAPPSCSAIVAISRRSCCCRHGPRCRCGHPQSSLAFFRCYLPPHFRPGVPAVVPIPVLAVVVPVPVLSSSCGRRPGPIVVVVVDPVPRSSSCCCPGVRWVVWCGRWWCPVVVVRIIKTERKKKLQRGPGGITSRPLVVAVTCRPRVCLPLVIPHPRSWSPGPFGCRSCGGSRLLRGRPCRWWLVCWLLLCVLSLL